MYLCVSSSPAWGRGLKFFLCQNLGIRRTSSPAWGRGLKLPSLPSRLPPELVVPRVGTWIEISPSGSRRRQKRLSPAWKRGLKSQDGSRDTNGNIVVPCVETWIEKIIRMGVRPYYRQQYNVFLAPRQRAWIGLKKGQHFHSGKTLSKEGCGEVLHKSPMLWIRRTERSASGIHWNLDRVPQR